MHDSAIFEFWQLKLKSCSSWRITACEPTCPFSKETGAVSTASDGSCPVLVKLLPAMHSYFGHESFRPGQLEAILLVLHRHDVLVKMPTGGGKTMCMFMPPLATSATAIGVVISPLVALMDQQVIKIPESVSSVSIVGFIFIFSLSAWYFNIY